MPLTSPCRTAALAFAFSTALAAVGPAAAGSGAGAGDVRLSTAQSKPHGTYLVDSRGRALYAFTADQQGAGGKPAASQCYDACAKAWPPLTVRGQPAIAPNLPSGLVGTVQRKDGSTQLTYGGWPLYYFARDQGPGTTTGQDVKGFSGEWYLVAPDGKRVAHKGK
ncbi:ATP-binding protein [Ramlibacter sp. AN1015]|uniref:COG4315 family predicted lipoprotein n=1 Tax=Ramlibacter sp. AN1015 TaxID=3133428 RepID=UPI0030BA620B